MDTLQAAVLRVKLTTSTRTTAAPAQLAAGYSDRWPASATWPVAEAPGRRSGLPPLRGAHEHRDALLAHLKAAGIGAGIHYPIPLHLQPALRLPRAPARRLPGRRGVRRRVPVAADLPRADRRAAGPGRRRRNPGVLLNRRAGRRAARPGRHQPVAGRRSFRGIFVAEQVEALRRLGHRRRRGGGRGDAGQGRLPARRGARAPAGPARRVRPGARPLRIERSSRPASPGRCRGCCRCTAVTSTRRGSARVTRLGDRG